MAQVTVKGTIKDITSGEPVEMATVSADGSNIVTVSNAEGLFRITVPDGTKSITISHLSYKEFSIPASDFGKDEINLEPTGIELEEVVVSNIPIEKILDGVVANSKKKLQKSLLLNTYYREFVKVNGVYTKFADGLLDYNVKRKNGAADLYVKQSRSARLATENSVEDNQLSDQLYLFDVGDAITYAYSFKGLDRMLSNKNYNYQMKTRTGSDGKAINIVFISPKPEYESVALEGAVTFDPVSNLILDMDIRYAATHKKYAREINVIFFKFTIYDQARKTSFKLDGDKYIMTYNRLMMNVNINMKKRLNDTFLFMSDNLVMDYKEGEFELDRSKRYKHRSLFEAGTNYTEEFWKTTNAIPLTQEEETIIKKLETVK